MEDSLAHRMSLQFRQSQSLRQSQHQPAKENKALLYQKRPSLGTLGSLFEEEFGAIEEETE